MKYRLRCGIVVEAPIVSEWPCGVRVVDTADENLVSAGGFTREELLPSWSVGRVRCLSGVAQDPLQWRGGAYGEQFDVVAEVTE